jgi:hypothetical protein
MNKWIEDRAKQIRTMIGDRLISVSPHVVTVFAAAEYLFDNRQGPGKGRLLFGQPEFWADLGEALYGAEDERVKKLRVIAERSHSAGEHLELTDFGPMQTADGSAPHDTGETPEELATAMNDCVKGECSQPIARGFVQIKDEPLPYDACRTCGGGGGNDPSGERGEDPNCQDCGGTGKRRPFNEVDELSADLYKAKCELRTLRVKAETMDLVHEKLGQEREIWAAIEQKLAHEVLERKLDRNALLECKQHLLVSSSPPESREDCSSEDVRRDAENMLKIVNKRLVGNE